MTRLSTGESRHCGAMRRRRKTNRGELVGELNLLVERKFIDQVDELFKDQVTHARCPLWM